MKTILLSIVMMGAALTADALLICLWDREARA